MGYNDDEHDDESDEAMAMAMKEKETEKKKEKTIDLGIVDNTSNEKMQIFSAKERAGTRLKELHILLPWPWAWAGVTW